MLAGTLAVTPAAAAKPTEPVPLKARNQITARFEVQKEDHAPRHA